MIGAGEALSKYEIVSNQVSYSLANRRIEKDVLPYCQKNDIALLAYYPLGHGELARGSEKMNKVCKRNSKTPSQVALNWLVSKPGVFAIPRASTPDHVRENLGGSEWQLSAEDIAELEAAYPA